MATPEPPPFIVDEMEELEASLSPVPRRKPEPKKAPKKATKKVVAKKPSGPTAADIITQLERELATLTPREPMQIAGVTILPEHPLAGMALVQNMSIRDTRRFVDGMRAACIKIGLEFLKSVGSPVRVSSQDVTILILEALPPSNGRHVNAEGKPLNINL